MSQAVPNSPTPNNLAAYCWSLADLLRGEFNKAVDDSVLSSDAHQNQPPSLRKCFLIC